MYNYYPQQQVQTGRTVTATPTIQAPFALKGRPVSSLEEARALSIDFDGSVFYFPDIANKRIYTKQINLDGTAALNMYELVPTPVEPTANDYVTRTEFEKTLQQIQQSLAGLAPQTVEKPNQSEPAAIPVSSF